MKWLLLQPGPNSFYFDIAYCCHYRNSDGHWFRSHVDHCSNHWYCQIAKWGGLQLSNCRSMDLSLDN